jgi:hypothetical protein
MLGELVLSAVLALPAPATVLPASAMIPKRTLCHCAFPAFMLCTDRPEKKPIYRKEHGDGAGKVETYQLRIDTSDDPFTSIEHLSYIPEFNLAVGISTRLRGSVHVLLRVDRGADGVLDEAYLLHVPWTQAASFASEEFPHLLSDAKRSGDVLAYLAAYLSARDVGGLEKNEEEKEYRAQREQAYTRVCP